MSTPLETRPLYTALTVTQLLKHTPAAALSSLSPSPSPSPSPFPSLFETSIWQHKGKNKQANDKYSDTSYKLERPIPAIDTWHCKFTIHLYNW